jgi:hypothetical protein
MKTLSYWMICASLVISAATANAQPGGFEMPTTGFVFNQNSRAIRPLVGVPPEGNGRSSPRRITRRSCAAFRSRLPPRARPPE